MYLARFSYDVAPANRERAHKTMRQELAAARKKGLTGALIASLLRRLERIERRQNIPKPLPRTDGPV